MTRLADDELTQTTAPLEDLEIEAAPPPPDTALARVATLAAEQRALELKLEELAQATKAAQAELTAIADKELPDAMNLVGLATFTLTTGEKVEVKTSYHASLSKTNAADACAWLDEHGASSLIRRNFALTFSRDQRELADYLISKLIETPGFEEVTFEDKTTVNPQTLSAFCREQAEGGASFPLQLLGCHVRTYAKITPPKSR